MDYSMKLMNSPLKKRPSTDRFVTPVKTHHSPSKSSLNSESKRNLLQNQHSSPNFTLNSSPSLSPTRTITKSSENIFGSPKSPKRFYPTKPLHVITLPEIQLDFYVQPLDWSKTNIIANALYDSLCFINPKNASVSYLMDSPTDISAVKFNSDGTLVSLGDQSGKLVVYDSTLFIKTYEYQLMRSSIICSDWKGDMILLGARQGKFAIFDTRSGVIDRKKQACMEEICSIKFSPDNLHFETASNDCRISMWDVRNLEKPFYVFTKHTAAVKAVCWSPYDSNIICTGGGTNDKILYQWNINNGDIIQSQVTGSQICNVFWNEEYNEIVTSHGYSQNQIALWKGSTLAPILSYQTHQQRVLFMSPSPDSTSVATASPDNTLQIWNFFSPTSKNVLDMVIR